ncbi:MAG: phosphatase PAP2 family protein [Bacteroidaceae bacterium]|nr:phosphatase PAP2 family protein [Bacteroidaceae bacterium]
MLEFITNIDTWLTLLLNGSDSVMLDTIAVTATKTSTWIPLGILLLYVLMRMKNWKNALLVILCVAIAITLADQMASGIFKPLVARLRPSHTPELQGVIDLVGDYRGGRYGFFSSHAANTCAVAVFLSLLFRKRVFTVAICSWAMVNSWTRLYLGVHYVGDIMVGLIWGAFVGWMVFRLYRFLTLKVKLEGVELLYTEKRAYLLAEAIVLTYAAIIIYAICKTIL